MNNKGIS